MGEAGRRGEPAGAGAEECPGPHQRCQSCAGEQYEYRETLYLPEMGQPHGVAAPHTCWHCKGRGYYCHAPSRCTPPHEL